MHMGTLRQSIAWWCYDRTDLQPHQLVRLAAEIGYSGFDLVDQQYWPLIKEHGLEVAAVNGHDSIADGLNCRANHDRIEREITAKLVLARQWGIANLIVFSGTRRGIDDEAGAEATAEGLRRVASAAEDAGVTLMLELLNSKVDHADYQADHTAWGVKVCQIVGSPSVRLLYDIYHMQIMEGDIIRTIQDNAAFFAHYHTGGNPGRHEIGASQELYYPAIARAILATGYTGYIGQEFIPTGDPAAALQEAFDACNVTTA
jgi:hydroxypyruvate isomerase